MSIVAGWFLLESTKTSCDTGCGALSPARYCDDAAFLAAFTNASTGVAACEETCNFSSDNDCDDGGAGSEFDKCAVGSDCQDCGPRYSGANTKAGAAA